MPSTSPAVLHLSWAPCTDGDIPPGLRCKLSGERLVNPVLARDGYSYERAHWDRWVEHHPHDLRSPVTGAPVSPTVVEQRHLRAAAQEQALGRTDLAPWVRDIATLEAMRQPVRMPDGLVCDAASVQPLMFSAARRGRSLLDPNRQFSSHEKIVPDLNLLELSEAVQGCTPYALPRCYVVPCMAALLRSAPLSDDLASTLSDGALTGVCMGALLAMACSMVATHNEVPAPYLTLGTLSSVSWVLVAGCLLYQRLRAAIE